MQLGEVSSRDLCPTTTRRRDMASFSMLWRSSHAAFSPCFYSTAERHC